MYAEKLSIIKKSLGSSYESNDELLFYCPKCKHHKRKLSVNIKLNVFKCWICDFKGNKLTPLIKDRDLKSQWISLTNQVDISRFDDFFAHLTKTEKTEESVALDLPEYFCSLTSKNLSAAGQEAKQYLNKRGVSDEEIYLYKIGFCHHGKYGNRIIIPSYDAEGDLNYYVARSYKEDVYLKYKNPPCSRDIVFNEIFIDWTKPVILVEGFFDSIKYENSIPILGSTLNTSSKLFSKIVEHCKSVYLCLDQDAKKKELKIAKNLLDFGVKVYKIELYSYNDLADVPNGLLNEYKKRASLLTREDYLLQKISFGG